eukprot:TRINITY_DN4492_c0_g1_i22.p1 TRINITY_DN4492_c0_g1~~TRINITY_DN4492_c0_g1_i22.p1  ORF type:complete len:302 (-),score=36.37 TRINITY_DN4492_c0_g1_i22:160-1065(-)
MHGRTTEEDDLLAGLLIFIAPSNLALVDEDYIIVFDDLPSIELKLRIVRLHALIPSISVVEIMFLLQFFVFIFNDQAKLLLTSQLLELRVLKSLLLAEREERRPLIVDPTRLLTAIVSHLRESIYLSFYLSVSMTYPLISAQKTTMRGRRSSRSARRRDLRTRSSSSWEEEHDFDDRYRGNESVKSNDSKFKFDGGEVIKDNDVILIDESKIARSNKDKESGEKIVLFRGATMHPDNMQLAVRFMPQQRRSLVYPYIMQSAFKYANPLFAANFTTSALLFLYFLYPLYFSLSSKISRAIFA